MGDISKDPFSSKPATRLQELLAREMPEEDAQRMSIAEVRTLIARDQQSGRTVDARDLQTALDDSLAALYSGPIDVPIQIPYEDVGGGRGGGGGGGAGGGGGIATHRTWPTYLTDVNHKILSGEIAKDMGLKHLAPAAAPALWPPPSLMYGFANRLIVCLPTSTLRGPAVNIFYLLDTGSPNTYLSSNALNALGVEVVTSSMSVIVNGLQDHANPSPAHHSDISLLGMRWFVANGVRIEVDPDTRSVTLRPRQPAATSST